MTKAQTFRDGRLMKGLWLVPSRRRLQKLQTFFDHAMNNCISTPGVVLVQKTELEEMKDAYAGLKMPAKWKIVPTNGDGLADKCREVWPAIKDMDWVGLGCDDLRPQTPAWDKTLLKHVNGKNIVTCNDTQQGNARMSGITVFSGPVLRAMGYMCAPHFWHTFLDNTWEDIGRGSGCWTYVDEVVVTHDHPFVNQKIDPAKADETTHRSYGQQQRDMAAYQHWVQTERDAVVARVKALQ